MKPTIEDQFQQIIAERDEARQEVDRLRACARAAAEKTVRVEWNGETLIVTVPHGTYEDELAIATAFFQIYQGMQEAGQAEGEVPS